MPLSAVPGILRLALMMPTFLIAHICNNSPMGFVAEILTLQSSVNLVKPYGVSKGVHS